MRAVFTFTTASLDLKLFSAQPWEGNLVLLVVTNGLARLSSFRRFPRLRVGNRLRLYRELSCGGKPANAWSQDRPTWFCRVRLGVTLDLDLL